MPSPTVGAYTVAARVWNCTRMAINLRGSCLCVEGKSRKFAMGPITKLTDSFDALDLKQAKALLDELAS